MRTLRKNLKGPVGISVINSVVQSFANGFTRVVFNTVEYVSGGIGWTFYDSSRLYARETGLYHLVATWTFEARAGGIRTAMFYKNGDAVAYGAPAVELGRMGQDAAMVGTTQDGGTFSRYLYLNEGDYVTMTVYQNSGSPLNSTPPGCSMALIKVN